MSRRGPTRVGRLVATLLQLSPSLAAAADQDAIVVYSAFGGMGGGTVEGRVVERKSSPAPATSDGILSNLRRNLGLLVNDERAGRTVRIQIGERSFETQTDVEGYFRVEIEDLDALARGWHPVVASVSDASGEAGLLLVPDTNAHGLISDLDDTILITEVRRKHRMVARSLLRNPLQRQAVEGMARLYQGLAARNPDPPSAPIFYVSGSPRQFHVAIQAFLDHNDYPRGVLITKRVTDDETSESLRDQVLYKTARIAEIFARTPHVRYTLIGDDAERDPEIYDEVRRLYPERVEAIWIRRVHPDAERPRLAGQADLDELLRAQP
jgi:phosphatidate phosphatase APP1